MQPREAPCATAQAIFRAEGISRVTTPEIAGVATYEIAGLATQEISCVAA